MKIRVVLLSLTTAILLLPAVSSRAQMTGTSHPEMLHDSITATPPQTAPHYVKPSPVVQFTVPTAPLLRRPVESATAAPAKTYRYDPDDMIVGSNLPVPLSDPMTPAVQISESRHPLPAAFDPDANIVTGASFVPGQIPEGTQLLVRLNTSVSTLDSRVGNTFTAELTRPVERRGEILLPVGSIIKGRVSEVHGGHRLGGPAMIRLQPDFITLPDGTMHRIDAQVSNVDNFSSSHVDSEGTIVGNEHAKAALVAVGSATGAGAVTGAVLGGGVGAAIGAGIGAGAGTIWFLKRDVQQSLPLGTSLVLVLNEPISLTAPLT